MRIIEFTLKRPVPMIPRTGDYFDLPNQRRAGRNSHVARAISKGLGIAPTEAIDLMGKTVRVTDAQFGVLAATLLAECGIVPIKARSVAFVTPEMSDVVDLTGHSTPALKPFTVSAPGPTRTEGLVVMARDLWETSDGWCTGRPKGSDKMYCDYFGGSQYLATRVDHPGQKPRYELWAGIRRLSVPAGLVRSFSPK